MNKLLDIRYSEDSLSAFNFKAVPNQNASREKSIRASLLSNSVKITTALFPDLSRVFSDVVSKLNYTSEIDGFVSPDISPQAFCISLSDQRDENEKLAVVVTSGLIQLLELNELQFVVGHEVGHYLYSHHSYPTPNDQTPQLQKLNLLQLSRNAEISADRVGFVCSPSVEDSFSCILKIATGLPGKYLNYDISSYLEQMREIKNLSGFVEQIYSTHPILPLRARALMYFSMSDSYYNYVGNKNTAPLNKARLDRKIADDFSQISGRSLDNYNVTAIKNFKLWAMLRIFACDNRLSENEQNLISNIFGETTASSAISFIQTNPDPNEAISKKLCISAKDLIGLPTQLRAELLSEIEGFVPDASSRESVDLVMTEIRNYFSH